MRQGLSSTFDASAADPAGRALCLPFELGTLAMPETAELLFLRARPGPVLTMASAVRWRCEQSLRPIADALSGRGLQVVAEADSAPAVLVLCLPPRQRDEARALFALALSRVESGGLVVAAMANDEGARSGEADLAALAGDVSSLSKHKCRVFWVQRDDARIDLGLLASWRALDEPQPILDGSYLSRPGLFAWDRVDPGSALLAGHLPDTLSGVVADLGAGWGYLAIELVRKCPRISALHLYEAEARALAPARANLERHGRGLPFELFWHDVSAGLPRPYDAIVSNPPFHQGRADQPDLGRAFIVAAADALHAHGELWLVANRHLPYEATLRARFATVEAVAAGQGYKVLHARGPRR